MAVITLQEWKEELVMYDDSMRERDTLLSAFRSLLHNRTDSSWEHFLAKVRRFVMVDLLRNALAV